MAVRKLLFVSAIAAALIFLAPTVRADQLDIETSYSIGVGGVDDDTGSSLGRAGEFGVDNFDHAIHSVGHSPESDYEFSTFCVERTEYVRNGTFFYTVSDRALSGGTTPTPGFDMLDAETAQLYYAFWTGQLDYDYDDSAGDRSSNASDLQLAVWYLEGEVTDAEFASLNANDGMADDYLAFAAANDWDDLGTSFADGSIGSVRVINLWSSRTTNANGDYEYSGHRQDQLVVLVPLPAAAFMGFVMLGGLGVVSVVRRRRRD